MKWSRSPSLTRRAAHENAGAGVGGCIAVSTELWFV